MQLAQANVATMRVPYDDPLMADFKEQLEAVNATADAAPGFVWRFVEDEEDGLEIARVFGGDNVLFNLSVWESISALQNWVYSGKHLDVVRKRAKWFETTARSPLVLWWIDDGHVPTIEEAGSRFELLWKKGPAPEAFTFSTRFETT